MFEYSSRKKPQRRLIMKKVLALAMAMAFTVSTASVSMAAYVKCTVKNVSGDTVTMECKKADRLNAGDSVTVKSKRKRAIEGC